MSTTADPKPSADPASARRRLIVNADDLGLCPAVNRGVFRAHTQGILTSASLMVRQPAVAATVVEARRYPRLSLGLHVDLGEWEYRDGEWEIRYQVVPVSDAAAVGAEVARQLASFRRFVGAVPTHLDSHQHLHRFEPVRAVLGGIAARLGLPLRQCTPGVTYQGGFYGQTLKGEPRPEALSVDALIRMIRELRPGTSELACHPADSDDVPSSYRTERVAEMTTLCDARVRAAVEAEGIELCSFRDLADR